MTDEGERDDKMLGVPLNDPELAEIDDIQDVSPVFLGEIEQFFREYKNLEGKTTEILGWKNTEKAFEAIEHSMELYNEMSSFKSLFMLK